MATYFHKFQQRSPAPLAMEASGTPGLVGLSSPDQPHTPRGMGDRYPEIITQRVAPTLTDLVAGDGKPTQGQCLAHRRTFPKVEEKSRTTLHSFFSLWPFVVAFVCLHFLTVFLLSFLFLPPSLTKRDVAIESTVPFLHP